MTQTHAELRSELVSWYQHAFAPIVKKEPFSEPCSEAYAAPLHYLDLDEELLLGDVAAVRAFLQGFNDWREESPDSSAEIARVQVQKLNDAAAILVADWRFNDPDGTPLAHCDPVQYFYLLSKQDAGWRIVGEATVGADTRIDLE